MKTCLPHHVILPCSLVFSRTLFRSLFKVLHSRIAAGTVAALPQEQLLRTVLFRRNTLDGLDMVQFFIMALPLVLAVWFLASPRTKGGCRWWRHLCKKKKNSKKRETTKNNRSSSSSSSSSGKGTLSRSSSTTTEVFMEETATLMKDITKARRREAALSQDSYRFLANSLKMSGELMRNVTHVLQEGVKGLTEPQGAQSSTWSPGTKAEVETMKQDLAEHGTLLIKAISRNDESLAATPVGLLTWDDMCHLEQRAIELGRVVAAIAAFSRSSSSSSSSSSSRKESGSKGAWMLVEGRWVLKEKKETAVGGRAMAEGRSEEKGVELTEVKSTEEGDQVVVAVGEENREEVIDSDVQPSLVARSQRTRILDITIDVDGRGGKHKEISVYAGDNHEVLAVAFVQEHGLAAGMVPTLTNHITRLVKAHAATVTDEDSEAERRNASFGGKCGEYDKRGESGDADWRTQLELEYQREGDPTAQGELMLSSSNRAELEQLPIAQYVEERHGRETRKTHVGETRDERIPWDPDG